MAEPWFDVLGVEPTASSEEVREAYLTLVKTWHPDRFATAPELVVEAEERLKAINVAYDQVRAGAWGAPDGGADCGEDDWPEWYESIEPARVRLLFVPGGVAVRAVALLLALLFAFFAVVQAVYALDLVAGK